MRAEAGRAALEVAVEPFVERGAVGGVAVVAQLRLVEPELAGPLGEGRPEQHQHLAARGDELRSELGGLLRPRLERARAGEPAATRRSAALRCATTAP